MGTLFSSFAKNFDTSYDPFKKNKQTGMPAWQGQAKSIWDKIKQFREDSPAQDASAAAVTSASVPGTDNKVAGAISGGGGLGGGGSWSEWLNDLKQKDLQSNITDQAQKLQPQYFEGINDLLASGFDNSGFADIAQGEANRTMQKIMEQTGNPVNNPSIQLAGHLATSQAGNLARMKQDEMKDRVDFLRQAFNEMMAWNSVD